MLKIYIKVYNLFCSFCFSLNCKILGSIHFDTFRHHIHTDWVCSFQLFYEILFSDYSTVYQPFLYWHSFNCPYFSLLMNKVAMNSYRSISVFISVSVSLCTSSLWTSWFKKTFTLYNLVDIMFIHTCNPLIKKHY